MKIKCLICNKYYNDLSTHLRSHNISKDEYRKRFNYKGMWYPEELRAKKFQLTEEQKAYKDKRIKEAHNTERVRKIKSDASKGKKNGFYNKTHSVKSKNKISLSLKEYYSNNNMVWNKGKTISKEQRYKNKIAALKLWKNKDYINKHKGKIKYKNLYLRSLLEKEVLKELDELNIDYLYEKIRIKYIYEGIEHTYIPDLYLLKYNLYIEIKSSDFINYNFMSNHNLLDSYNLIMIKFNSIKGNKIFITEKDLGNIKQCLIKS